MGVSRSVKNHYLTIVNGRYALRALVLYRSLEPYLNGHSYAVYCIDQESAELLEALKLPRLEVVQSADFETPELCVLRSKRNISEYCWTLKPVVIEHSMMAHPEMTWGVYLDSDMMAFGDPNLGLEVEKGTNVVITPHRPSNEYFSSFTDRAGRFNAGYVAFRKSVEGINALSWWKDRCFEGTPIIPRDGMYADQKYLDRLEVLFSGVVASEQKGLNAGPWNVVDNPVKVSDRKVYVDGHELLLFHMQGFKVLNYRIYDLYAGPVKIDQPMRELIYRPYVEHIAQAWRALERANGGYLQLTDFPLRRARTWIRELREITLGRSNFMFR